MAKDPAKEMADVKEAMRGLIREVVKEVLLEHQLIDGEKSPDGGVKKSAGDDESWL